MASHSRPRKRKKRKQQGKTTEFLEHSEIGYVLGCFRGLGFSFRISHVYKMRRRKACRNCKGTACQVPLEIQTMKKFVLDDLD